MGLDMYINATLYLSELGNEKELLASIRSACASHLGGFKVNGVRATLGYWRKANAIHKWFVDNVQDGADDCRDAPLKYEHLVKLREDCATVLAEHSKAQQLLPPTSGFFFGGTDLDEWYFKDLEKTIEIIDMIFANPIVCASLLHSVKRTA